MYIQIYKYNKKFEFFPILESFFGKCLESFFGKCLESFFETFSRISPKELPKKFSGDTFGNILLGMFVEMSRVGYFKYKHFCCQIFHKKINT